MEQKSDNSVASMVLWAVVFAVLVSCALLIKLATNEVKILFFGDLMLDRGVERIIETKGIDYIFEHLHDKQFTHGYDFVTANLEGAVTKSGQHYPPENLYDFAFNPASVEKLKNYGFNMFSVANNHLFDQGQRGIDETNENLSSLGFYHYGCRDGIINSIKTATVKGGIINEVIQPQQVTQENCSAIIVEKKGYRIAFLSFSCVYTAIEKKRILSTIEQLRTKSDFVIVSPHWGVEYQQQANHSQKSLAHAMIDAGADAVIGHHPHVIQNHETYKNRPIYYSLGNFIFDQYFSEKTQKGLAVSLRLSRNTIRHDSYLITSKRSRIESIEKVINARD